MDIKRLREYEEDLTVQQYRQVVAAWHEMKVVSIDSVSALEGILLSLHIPITGTIQRLCEEVLSEQGNLSLDGLVSLVKVCKHFDTAEHRTVLRKSVSEMDESPPSSTASSEVEPHPRPHWAVSSSPPSSMKHMKGARRRRSMMPKSGSTESQVTSEIGRAILTATKPRAPQGATPFYRALQAAITRTPNMANFRRRCADLVHLKKKEMKLRRDHREHEEMMAQSMQMPRRKASHDPALTSPVLDEPGPGLPLRVARASASGEAFLIYDGERSFEGPGDSFLRATTNGAMSLNDPQASQFKRDSDGSSSDATVVSGSIRIQPPVVTRGKSQFRRPTESSHRSSVHERALSRRPTVHKPQGRRRTFTILAGDLPSIPRVISTLDDNQIRFRPLGSAPHPRKAPELHPPAPTMSLRAGHDARRKLATVSKDDLVNVCTVDDDGCERPPLDARLYECYFGQI